VAQGAAKVFTDPQASPTGFPFKVAEIEGTASSRAIYEQRTRLCDLGYLRQAYVDESGKLGYRCAAEPLVTYEAKGGKTEVTSGSKCLCNSLMANVGYAQRRADGAIEPALVTLGDDLNLAAEFLKPGQSGYSAADVVGRLLDGVAVEKSEKDSVAASV
jgi:nitronate monooxygenase